MGVSLYTVRVVLDVLGVEDYGIYSVIGGMVSMLTFLSGSMASATRRFFSFALGAGDPVRLKRIYTVNLVIYGGIAVIALIFFETVGLWFVNNWLDLPPDRFEAARTLYNYSVFTFVIGIFTSPFMAIIIAHEDMHFYAYISVIDALLRLAAVFLLTYISGDKLALYGALVLGVALLKACAFIAACLLKYEECRLKDFSWDGAMLREILGFTGWTLFGQVSSVARNQAVTILLNQSFNPFVVAARAVSTNVATQILTFSRNFTTGLYPPIIKHYAAGEKTEMFALIFTGSKISFFLMWVITLPLLLEMKTVLTVWLTDPPENAIVFTRLALIEVLIQSVSSPLATAARAPGKMMMYELSLGSIQLGIFVVSWIVLKIGAQPYSVFVVAIIANLLMFYVRLVLLRGMIQLSIKQFMRQAAAPILSVLLVSSLVALAVDAFLPDGLIFGGVGIIGSGLIAAITIYYVGMSPSLRGEIVGTIKRRALGFLGNCNA